MGRFRTTDHSRSLSIQRLPLRLDHLLSSSSAAGHLDRSDDDLHLIDTCLLCALAIGITSAAAVESHQVTVGSPTGRTFLGTGVSFTNSSPPGYAGLDDDGRGLATSLLWRDANCRAARLWLNMTSFSPSPGNYDLTDFSERLVDSGLLPEAQAAGLDTLLLAPTNIPPYLRTDPDASDYSNQVIKDDEAARQYGEVLAEAVIRLYDELGILCQATGIQNEPNARVDFTPAQLAIAGDALRSALTAAGEPYASVAIVGPECASVDGTCDDFVQALLATDPLLIDALAAHSYNMALKEFFTETWFATGLPYWNTEAGNTVLGEDSRPYDHMANLHGADLSARLLNDIRHGCTWWIWFVGYAQAANDHRDQQRLIRWQSDHSVETLPTYHYFAALSTAFTPGTEILGVQADPAMPAWTHGRKPKLIAAAGTRPDGSLVIGLCNYTSAIFPDEPDSGTDFYRANVGYHARRLDIDLHIPDGLLDDPGTIDIHRLGQDQTTLTEQLTVPTAHTSIAYRSTLGLQLEPMELLVLTIANSQTRDRRVDIQVDDQIEWQVVTPDAALVHPPADGRQRIEVDRRLDLLLSASEKESI